MIRIGLLGASKIAPQGTVATMTTLEPILAN